MKWVIVTGLLVTLARFGGGKVLTPLVVSRTSNENIARTLDTDVSTETKTNDEKLLLPPTTASKKTIEEEERDPKQFVHNLVKRAVCKPNQDFQSECNACKCSPDGQRYTCTQNECLEKDMNKEVEVFMESEGVDHIERHSVCRPRDTFYIGCNTCNCNLYGTDYSCTNKPCPLPEDVELFHELKITKSSKNSTKEVVCVANRMFIKDCNTCWCNDDGTSYFCTRKVCIPDLPDETSTEEDKPENLTTLSRRVRATDTEKLKVCTPREEFRLDCNTCLCDDEGQSFSCTRIDCYKNGGGRKKRGVSDLQKITLTCNAGSVFERDCNTCRCADEGDHAMCTKRSCQSTTRRPEPEKGNTGTDPHNPDSDPGFRCNPGEQFKRDCKDCTCSADGKSYFCTLRLCDEFMAPGI